jgi:hypothetical protein
MGNDWFDTNAALLSTRPLRESIRHSRATCGKADLRQISLLKPDLPSGRDRIVFALCFYGSARIEVRVLSSCLSDESTRTSFRAETEFLQKVTQTVFQTTDWYSQL